MKTVKSCGCIVLNDDLVLLISSMDDNNVPFWSFPKGLQEDGESDFATAIRETKEEVGLDVEIIDPEPIEVGHFIHNGTDYKNILLYLAKPLSNDITLQEEEVNSFEWMPIEKVKEYLKGYYLDAWNICLNRLSSSAKS